MHRLSETTAHAEDLPHSMTAEDRLQLPHLAEPLWTLPWRETGCAGQLARCGWGRCHRSQQAVAKEAPRPQISSVARTYQNSLQGSESGCCWRQVAERHRLPVENVSVDLKMVFTGVTHQHCNSAQGYICTVCLRCQYRGSVVVVVGGG